MNRIIAVLIGIGFSMTAAHARAITVVSSSSTLPISCDGDIAANGGYAQLTLPAAPATDGCDIYLMNADAAGKYLIGFPSDVNPKLYPNQGIGVTSLNGSWIAKHKPGRYRMPGSISVFVSNSGLDTNDGLSPSTPLQHNYAAVRVVQKDLDTQQALPTIALQAGSTFADDPINLGGQPTGGNLIGLTVYGGPGAATITNANAAAINIGDNAELDYELTANTALVLRGNYNDMPGQASGIYEHNNGLWDGNLAPGSTGNLVVIGNGPNTSAFFFDGPTPGASSAATIQVGGQFGDIWHMDEGGGRFTLSSTIQPITWNGRPCYANRLLAVLGTEQLILGGGPNQFPGGYASLGPSVVGGHALIIGNPAFIAGGITQTQFGHIYQTKF